LSSLKSADPIENEDSSIHLGTGSQKEHERSVYNTEITNERKKYLHINLEEDKPEDRRTSNNFENPGRLPVTPANEFLHESMSEKDKIQSGSTTVWANTGEQLVSESLGSEDVGYVGSPKVVRNHLEWLHQPSTWENRWADSIPGHMYSNDETDVKVKFDLEAFSDDDVKDARGRFAFLEALREKDQTGHIKHVEVDVKGMVLSGQRIHAQKRMEVFLNVETITREGKHFEKTTLALTRKLNFGLLHPRCYRVPGEENIVSVLSITLSCSFVDHSKGICTKRVRQNCPRGVG